jgi:hypothetical protein
MLTEEIFELSTRCQQTLDATAVSDSSGGLFLMWLPGKNVHNSVARAAPGDGAIVTACRRSHYPTGLLSF